MNKKITPGVALGGIAVVLAMSGSAVAGSLITSAQIKDGTIQSKDIKKNSITLNRLSPGAQATIKRAGTPGAAGATGATGATGAAGATGAQGPAGPSVQGSPGPVMSSGNWGLVNRNTEGSPNADLRSGPLTPPVGTGALNLTVKDGTEKIAFGNELDFQGDLVEDLEEVGFRVLTTGENRAKGNGNLPGITFEIDPNRAASTSNYSSLVFLPADAPANQWSGYIDATTTGKWGLTGGAFDANTCSLSLSNGCSFDQVMAVLNDGGEAATILTVAVAKGKDNSWQGAVDGLRINDTVFDFEETGVFERAAE